MPCPPDPAEACSATAAPKAAHPTLPPGAPPASQAGLQTGLQAYQGALAHRSAGRSAAVQAALRPRPQAVWASAPGEPAPRDLPPSPLAALLRHLHTSASSLANAEPLLEGSARADIPVPAADRSACRELRALRQAGPVWAQLRVQQQLRQSLAQAPERAGPLNSHGLVLRTLQELQALAPAYLLRFMAQMDTLFALDQLQPQATAPATTPTPAQGLRGATAQRPQRRAGRS